MTQADSVHSTPRTDSSSSDLQRSIEDAENFLKSQGFWLIANTCDWTNIDGDDAGIYTIDGYWGKVKAWRVEINRRVRETSGKGLCLSLRLLAGPAILPPAVAGWVMSELTPKAVLTDFFEEELLPDPAAMADAVIQRLVDAGFEIRPAERHKS